MFPFLNSKLFQQSSLEKFTINKVHAVCNISNIKEYIPHKSDVPPQ